MFVYRHSKSEDQPLIVNLPPCDSKSIDVPLPQSIEPFVGVCVGVAVGVAVGADVGVAVGAWVGAAVGAAVGADVGA